MKAFFREVAIIIILALIIYAALQAAVQNFRVEGSSMEPSIHEGQYILVNKAIYFFRSPERGDVIILHAPNNSRQDYIKRIIGIPGDTVVVNKGIVYINGTPLVEPYIKEPPEYRLSSRQVPPDRYFVLGDNRNNSADSHNGWFVPRENIIGLAWVCLWPPYCWGLAPNHQIQLGGLSEELSPMSSYPDWLTLLDSNNQQRLEYADL